MGITGLLPLLKSIHKSRKLEHFRGQTIGIDAYVWLHRGAHSCAVPLALGQPTNQYIRTVIKYTRLLSSFGVKPYFVFDGDLLPSKALTEASRADRRAAAKKAGLDLLAAGKTAAATTQLQQCIDVTPQMARNLIAELEARNVPYIVAPYEADAQLVYLERIGLISGIISEDSDLLVFGAKCLLTKLDMHGDCVEISRREFSACREVSLAGWTDADFRRMAILSGCDYFNGIPGVGLKTAYKLLRKFRTPERLVRMLELEGKYRLPPNFLADFYQAELTFLHQRVFCPTKQELVLLTQPPPGCNYDPDKLLFIGSPVEHELARAIARGRVDPITKLAIPAPKTPLPSPAATRTRQATQTAIVANSDRRKPKPINLYFKRHDRVPMGEMDPNCFAIDQKRLSLLTDNGLSPVVFPLPRPYVDVSAAHLAASPVPSCTPSSTPWPTRSQSSPPGLTNPSANSSRSHTLPLSLGRALDDANSILHSLSPRPSKKARLCEDVSAPSVDFTAGRGSSKYFPVQGKESCNSPKRSKSESYLLSDDSIDQALMNLPDVELWNPTEKGRASFSVFIDHSVNYVSEPCAQPGSKTQSRLNDRQEDVQPASPVVGPKSLEHEPSPKVTVERQMPPALPLQTPLQARLQCFTYSPSSSATSAANPSSLVSTPSSPVSRRYSKRAQIFTPTSTTRASPLTPPTALTTAPPRRRSHLELLGARALARARTLPSPGFVAQSPCGPSARPGRSSAARSDANSALSRRFPANPAFVPLPPVSLDEVEALNRPCGSEDLLIGPCSGGDAGGDRGEEDVGAETPL